MTLSRAKLITLDQRGKGYSHGKEHLTYCRKCNKEFQIGDEIVTKKSKNHTRWYHRECAEILNIWWDGC